MLDNDCKVFFNKNNIKYTKQRSAIYNILVNSDAPLTVENIFLKSKSTNIDISLSTIYRILDLFVDKRVVTIGGADGKKATYEINSYNHRHHVICLKCKKRQVLEHCPFENYEKFLSNSTNFEITDHKLDIYGFCPDCKNNNNIEDK